MIARNDHRISFYPGTRNVDGDARTIVLVSHDLSASGAPKIVLEIAEILLAAGYQVIVAAPGEGVLRDQFVALGASVVIAGNILDPTSAILRLLAELGDVAICNTVVTAGAVRGLGSVIPTFWYLHEVTLLADMLALDNDLAAIFAVPHEIWSGSELTAELVRPFRADVEVVPYGLTPLVEDVVAIEPTGPARIGIFGSLEGRKGQDLAVEAVNLLAPSVRDSLHLSLYGRVLDKTLAAGIADRLRDLPMVCQAGELDTKSYVAAMLGCDAVLVPSRSDTLPLVSLDALGAGRLLLCTHTTGTSAYLIDGVSGFVCAPDAASIAAMLTRALAVRPSWSAIGGEGRLVFEESFSKPSFTRGLESAITTALRSRVRSVASS